MPRPFFDLDETIRSLIVLGAATALIIYGLWLLLWP